MLIPFPATVMTASLAADAPKQPATVAVTGDWQITVSPGAIKVGDKTVGVTEPVTLTVAPATRVHVTDEKYETLKPFNAKAAPWARGTALRALATYETTAPEMLRADSVRLKSAPGPDAPLLQRGTDYELEPTWACVGSLPGKALGTVYADYDAGLGRIDTVAVDAEGKISLRQGTPHNATPHPPELKAGESRLLNLWIPGNLERLTSDNLYILRESSRPLFAFSAKTIEKRQITYPGGDPVTVTKETPLPVTISPAGQRQLPKTWARLISGQTLKVMAWGDSVTVGAQASDTAHRYQDQFVTRLRSRFPQATVTLDTVAWGGRTTAAFLAEPPGSQYNFQEKVLNARPDLIVMEFVNDASLTPAQVEERYSGLLARFKEIGAEWVILTPHFVWGGWMGTGGAKVEHDPRPYVAGLKQFVARHQADGGLALADASHHWEQLASQGIPYQTLLCNSLNHPDDRGHKLFADALMELFGE